MEIGVVRLHIGHDYDSARNRVVFMVADEVVCGRVIGPLGLERK
jgi:hypothetical protein